MNQIQVNKIIEDISKVLSEDNRIVFAYLYGSTAQDGLGNDIDIAVYSVPDLDFHQLSADLKIALHKRTGLSPDNFDIGILNGLLEQIDLFGLLYLKNVLNQNLILVDKDPSLRSDFLYRYGLKFRECEGLIQEIME